MKPVSRYENILYGSDLYSFTYIFNPYCGEYFASQTAFDPVRGRMPPEGAKQKTVEAADINVEIIDTLSPFEKQMMDRIDELHGTLKDI